MNKNKKIQELLSLLDLPEAEQCKYLYEYFKDKYYPTDEWSSWYSTCAILLNDVYPGRKVVLTNLAFRLRDETRLLDKSGYFFEAREIICFKISSWYEREKKEGKETRSSLHDAGIWFTRDAQPIAWIVAALIAMELANE